MSRVVDYVRASAWLMMAAMMIFIAADETDRRWLQLKTRPNDGAVLCALDPPSTSASPSQRMLGAPDVVRCSMACSNDKRCKHFNYVATESEPCQLYHYRPTSFDVVPNCQHFHEPGRRQTLFVANEIRASCGISLKTVFQAYTVN